MITRRTLLKQMLLAGGMSLLPFGRRNWALAAEQGNGRHLVVILMRGAVDGLSIVTPYMERNYYRVRSSIALPPPNANGGLINLDGYFGLNPALSALMPLWNNRTLAFVQASGSPSETRSHFEAQDVIETAMMNTALATQGWMNGLERMLPDNHAATRALSFGNTLPKIFQGKSNVATVPMGLHGGANAPVENPQLQAALEQMYGKNAELGGLYKEGVSAQKGMMMDLQNEMQNASGGAPNADAFAQQASKAGEMIRNDPNIQLVFMDVGGWDTHIGQGNNKGQLSNKLEKLSEGLVALTQNLGPAYANTTVLIMSEFGRTVAENGNGGTDHGHGNVAWLMGGGVRGGKIWGRWPGLEQANLFEGRDLAVTTDFRSIVGSAVAGTFGLDDAHIAAVIPGYVSDPSLRDIVAI